MRKSGERRTVDLSAYPDLVMILLGMRVRTLAGLKTLIGFGPEIARSVDQNPTVCYSTKTSYGHCFRYTRVFANIGEILNHWSAGRDRNLIACGGKNSCAIR